MKIPHSLPFGKGFFGKIFFCSSENSLLGYSKSLFQKKATKANANFCVFESQSPKIMVLLKALKAKLSLIPSGVISLSMSSHEQLENRQAFVQPLAVATPHAWEACCRPLSIMVWFARSFGYSVSWGRKVGLPLEVWQESWPNFRWLPKVSEVATNHWVFLRCDLSPISNWFYYQS